MDQGAFVRRMGIRIPCGRQKRTRGWEDSWFSLQGRTTLLVTLSGLTSCAPQSHRTLIVVQECPAPRVQQILLGWAARVSALELKTDRDALALYRSEERVTRLAEVRGPGNTMRVFTFLGQASRLACRPAMPHLAASLKAVYKRARHEPWPVVVAFSSDGEIDGGADVTAAARRLASLPQVSVVVFVGPLLFSAPTPPTATERRARTILAPLSDRLTFVPTIKLALSPEMLAPTFGDSPVIRMEPSERRS